MNIGTPSKLVPVALRNRNFALFWGGLVLSGMGSQFTTVAMAWQIYLLTGSPLEIGLLGLARAVPQMIILLYGGLLADAFDRRRLMMAVQVGQFGVSGTLLLFSATGAVTPLILYVAAGLLAVFTALETPSRQALVPNLVSREELTSALALNNAQRNVSNIAGPSLAGLLLAFADPGWCYAVDALSWLVMLGALLLITARADLGSRRGTMSLNALGEGLHFVLTNPVILGFMVLDFGMTLFANPRALFPIYAEEILRVGAPGLGVLHAAVAAGGIVGAVGMGGRRRAGWRGLLRAGHGCVRSLPGLLAFGSHAGLYRPR